MKVAAIQLESTKDKQQNLQRALYLASIAVERGANFLCFPELFPTHWFPAEVDKEAFKLAEPLDGPLMNEMKSFAQRYGVSLVVPFFEEASGKFFNSAAVISSRGEVVGVYRKVHLPEIPLWEERAYFEPGDSFPVFEVDGVKVGIQLSWDNLFPEGPRILGLKGAQVLFAPTACAFRTQQRWLKLLSGHAICNGFFVVRVNRVGKERHQYFYGMSFFLNPDGELLTEPAGVEEGVLLAEMDLAEVKRTRRKWYLFSDRRPDLYRELLP